MRRPRGEGEKGESNGDVVCTCNLAQQGSLGRLCPRFQAIGGSQRVHSGKQQCPYAGER